MFEYLSPQERSIQKKHSLLQCPLLEQTATELQTCHSASSSKIFVISSKFCVRQLLYKKINKKDKSWLLLSRTKSICRAFKLYCNFLDCFFVCLKNVKIRSTENQSVNQPSNLSVNHYSVRRLMIKSLSVNVIQPVNRHKANVRLLPFIILW